MKLVIPTRNRPESLSSVLAYLEKFYPETSVRIADGSRDDLKKEVAGAVGKFTRLDIEFKSYPFDMSFYDRMLDVLESEPEEYIALNADDDYPMVDALRRGEAFLKKNPGYVLAIGMLMIFEIDPAGRISANVRQVRSINHDTTEGRVRQFSAWPFPLSYSVCRRHAIIARNVRAKDVGIGEMFDMFGGLSDCLEGKVHAMPEVSIVLTRNPNEQYLRLGSKLEFLERGPEIASMVRQFAAEFQKKSGLEEAAALRLSTDIFARRVGSYLTGIPYHQQPFFINSNIHRHNFLTVQCNAFERMFQSGSVENLKYRERLEFVRANLCTLSGFDAKAAPPAAFASPAAKPPPATPHAERGAAARLKAALRKVMPQGMAGWFAAKSVLPRVNQKIAVDARVFSKTGT